MRHLDLSFKTHQNIETQIFKNGHIALYTNEAIDDYIMTELFDNMTWPIRAGIMATRMYHTLRI